MSKIFILALVLLSFLSGNPFFALVILLLVIFFVDRRFVGILPDIFAPWRRSKRVRQLKRDIKINPANAEFHLELGEAYFRKGKYLEALSFLERAYAKMEGTPFFISTWVPHTMSVAGLMRAEKSWKRQLASTPRLVWGSLIYIWLKSTLKQGCPMRGLRKPSGNFCYMVLPWFFTGPGGSFCQAMIEKGPLPLSRDNSQL
ncbi:MAG: hypothetical protein RQM92_16470 [Candidatus Syntrophopropionicum ammoniitolerans]